MADYDILVKLMVVGDEGAADRQIKLIDIIKQHNKCLQKNYRNR